MIESNLCTTLDKKNRMDIGIYMFNKMLRLVLKPTSRMALPFGRFVCSLGAQHGVANLESDVYMKRKGPIKKLTFDRLLHQEQAVPQSTEGAGQRGVNLGDST